VWLDVAAKAGVKMRQLLQFNFLFFNCFEGDITFTTDFEGGFVASLVFEGQFSVSLMERRLGLVILQSRVATY
jgi:hypothetical protein